MKKFIRVILLTINFTFVLFLLLSYIGGMTNPATKLGSFIYFFSLAYPVFVLLNIGFIIFWLYRKRWFFLISLFSIALGYQTFYRTFPIHFSKKELAPPNSVKFLSYNVGGFYQHNEFTKNSEGVVQLILDEQPDIVCMQEVNFINSSKYKFTEEDLFKRLKDYPYKSIQYLKISKTRKYGNAIFSKFPIVKQGRVKTNEDTMLDIAFADVVVHDKRIRVFGPHLNPNRLKVIQQDFYEEMTNKGQKELKGEVKYIAQSLGKAARKRGLQVNAFKEEMDASPFPIIVAGDFNDAPGTYTYNYLSKNLVDAKVKHASGLGATYNGNYPSFRIDFILHSPCIKSYEYKKINNKFSDHDAISCELDFSDCK